MTVVQAGHHQHALHSQGCEHEWSTDSRRRDCGLAPEIHQRDGKGWRERTLARTALAFAQDIFRMNAVFFAIVLVAFLVGGYHQWNWEPSAADSVSPMAALGTAMVDAAGGAVTLAIGLVGMMALFLGLMKVAEAGGLLTVIAKTLRPLMVRVFPEVPADHPAMGAMILNLSAKRPRPRQRRDAVRHPRDAGARQAEPGQRDGEQCDGAVSGHEHLIGHVAAHWRHCVARRGRFPGPGGHPADDAVCDLRLDGSGIRCREGVPTVLGGGTCRDARVRGARRRRQ